LCCGTSSGGGGASDDPPQDTSSRLTVSGRIAYAPLSRGKEGVRKMDIRNDPVMP
jgi:hypothetical protein